MTESEREAFIEAEAKAFAEAVNGGSKLSGQCDGIVVKVFDGRVKGATRAERKAVRLQNRLAAEEARWAGIEGPAAKLKRKLRSEQNARLAAEQQRSSLQTTTKHLWEDIREAKRLERQRIGGILRRERQSSGYTLADIALRIGTSHGMLSRLERGLRPVHTKEVDMLAYMYECDAEIDNINGEEK